MPLHPWIATRPRQAVAGLALVACVAVALVEKAYRPPGEYGWFTLEFPALLKPPPPDAWTPTFRDRSFFGLGLDFLFLCLYPFVLSLWCGQIGMASRAPKWLARVCAIAAPAVGIALPMDALENVGLLLWLQGTHSSALDTATSIAAGIKWFLILVAAIVCAGGILILSFRWAVRQFQRAN